METWGLGTRGVLSDSRVEEALEAVAKVEPVFYKKLMPLIPPQPLSHRGHHGGQEMPPQTTGTRAPGRAAMLLRPLVREMCPFG